MDENNIDNDLKKLHGVMVEILDEFVRICDENNFTYFMIAGTLLGAVRHKGFIPWDDDIDVAMPRSDYEKFLDYCEKNRDMNYYTLSNKAPVNSYYHYIPFAKFCKKGTIFAEKTREEKNYCGIFIDLWPYDNANLFFLPLQSFLFYFGNKIYKAKTYTYTPRKKINAILYKFLPSLLPLFMVKFFKQLSNVSCTFFNKYTTKYFTFFSGFYGFIKETHKYRNIFPLTKILFENKYYNAPANPDHFLKKLYGDYLKIPKAENRKVHNKFIVFDTSNMENK